ncbi:DUF7159 family protein [Mycobacterium sp. BMJ-28]
MDAVLGLSMTPTSLGLVVVGGDDPADAAAGDAFALKVDGGTDVRAATEQVTAAVEAISAARGHRLKSIGVTWSDEAGADAAMLMDSLSESGFGNVVPIRLPEATEALALGMAEVIGYRTTAVCVVEPDTVIALIVHAGHGGVQTAINHGIDSDASLVGWLSTVFTRADWQPEALVVVGSAGDFSAVLPHLEDALSVPVFAPAEAQLALARGAALASTHSLDQPFEAMALRPRGSGRHAAGTGRVSPTAALTTVLAAGVVTFVMSASVAAAVALSPEQAIAGPRTAAASARLSEAVAPAVVPVQIAVPAPEAPPAVTVPQAPVDASAEVPAAAPGDIADAAPPVDADTEAPVAVPVDTMPQLGPDPAVAAALPPAMIVPPAVVPPAPPVKKSLFDRIRDRLHPGADDDYPNAVIPAPAG